MSEQEPVNADDQDQDQGARRQGALRARWETVLRQNTEPASSGAAERLEANVDALLAQNELVEELVRAGGDKKNPPGKDRPAEVCPPRQDNGGPDPPEPPEPTPDPDPDPPEPIPPPCGVREPL